MIFILKEYIKNILLEAKTPQREEFREDVLRMLKKYKDDPSVYVHMASSIESPHAWKKPESLELGHGPGKIGINPQFSYDEPLGIYAYPLKEMWQDFVFDRLPYAGSRPWVYVFRVKDEYANRVLYDIANTYSDADYNRDSKKIISIYENKISKNEMLYLFTHIMMNSTVEMIIYKFFTDRKIGMDYRDIMQHAGSNVRDSLKTYLSQLERSDLILLFLELCEYKVQNPGKRLLYATRMITEGFMHSESRQNIVTAAWSKLLRNLGYVGIVDLGASAIHSNEPYQAVFFQKKYIEVIDVSRNKRRSDVHVDDVLAILAMNPKHLTYANLIMLNKVISSTSTQPAVLVKIFNKFKSNPVVNNVNIIANLLANPRMSQELIFKYFDEVEHGWDLAYHKNLNAVIKNPNISHVTLYKIIINNTLFSYYVHIQHANSDAVKIIAEHPRMNKVFIQELYNKLITDSNLNETAKRSIATILIRAKKSDYSMIENVLRYICKNKHIFDHTTYINDLLMVNTYNNINLSQYTVGALLSSQNALKDNLWDRVYDILHWMWIRNELSLVPFDAQDTKEDDVGKAYIMTTSDYNEWLAGVSAEKIIKLKQKRGETISAASAKLKATNNYYAELKAKT